MSNIIEFPIEQVQLKVAKDRLVNRLEQNDFNDDEILMIMEEIDEIINISQFDLVEATRFVDSIDGTYNNQVEIIGAINDN